MVKSAGMDPSDLLLYRNWNLFTREAEEDEELPQDIFDILYFDVESASKLLCLTRCTAKIVSAMVLDCAVVSPTQRL